MRLPVRRAYSRTAWENFRDRLLRRLPGDHPAGSKVTTQRLGTMLTPMPPLMIEAVSVGGPTKGWVRSSKRGTSFSRKYAMRPAASSMAFLPKWGREVWAAFQGRARPSGRSLCRRGPPSAPSAHPPRRHRLENRFPPNASRRGNCAPRPQRPRNRDRTEAPPVRLNRYKACRDRSQLTFHVHCAPAVDPALFDPGTERILHPLVYLDRIHMSLPNEPASLRRRRAPFQLRDDIGTAGQDFNELDVDLPAASVSATYSATPASP